MGSDSLEKAEKRQNDKVEKVKKGLGWIEWLRGWFNVIYEMLFQRIAASHLQDPMPLPPIENLTCIVTGSTSGIGREIARSLFLYIVFPIVSCASHCIALSVVIPSSFVV